MANRYYFGDIESQEQMLRTTFLRMNMANELNGDPVRHNVEHAIARLHKQVRAFYGLDKKYKGNGDLRV